jgi:hypothetical protein
MDDGIKLIIVLFVVAAVSIFILALPSMIGKSRGISQDHLNTIRILSILGLLLGITWVVALILACVYPPVPKVYLPRVRAKALNYPEVDLGKELGFTQEEETPVNVPTACAVSVAEPIATVALDTCENCGRVIGKLETPVVWKDHIVCAACYKVLRVT